MPRMQRGSYRKDRKRGNKPVIPTALITGGITFDENGRKFGQSKLVYVQNGRFFDPGGRELTEPPQFVLDDLAELGKTNKKRLTELGFELKRGKVSPAVFSNEREAVAGDAAE